MKNKNTALPWIILLLGLVAAVAVSLVFCIAEKPVITQQRFPFSVTYEIGGQTVTVADEYVCSYTGPGQSVDPGDRFYDGVFAGNREQPQCGDYLIRAYEDGELVLMTNFFAGYMMGDPLYRDHYTEYSRFEPYIAFYDYGEYVEYEEAEVLAPYDVRIVDWEYPQPVENTFVFAGFTRLTPANVLPMLLVALVTLLACILFVKKEGKGARTTADTLGTVLNIGIGAVVLPFLTIVCILTDVNGDGADLLSQIAFCVPAITAFGLAASVCLRRKGCSRAAIAASFTGIGVMALVLIADTLVFLLN